MGLPKQNPYPERDDSNLVAFVSGLNLGGESADNLSMEMMVDFLTAQIGSSGVSQGLAGSGALIHLRRMKPCPPKFPESYSVGMEWRKFRN